MAPVFRAGIAVGALLLFATADLDARWRNDPRHELAPPPAGQPVFVPESAPPQPVEVALPDLAKVTEPPASGVVSVSFCVNKDGEVKHVTLLRSLTPQLDAQAIAAVRAWRFTPAQRQRKAEKARVEVMFTFSPQGVSAQARHLGHELPLPGDAAQVNAEPKPAPNLVDREASMLPLPYLNPFRVQ